MGVGLITEYPLWFIIFCILLGAGYAIAFYYKDKKLTEVNRYIKVLMSAFRFVVVAFLSFLLLHPLIRNISRTIEKPIVIFAQDNSQSIRSTRDSAFYLKDYIAGVNSMLDKFSGDYIIDKLEFGEEFKNQLSFSYSDKQTNFSDFFDKLTTNYFNRNVGALIVASDGIYNSGQNPSFASSEISFPIYSLALGDTSKLKDSRIKQVILNKIAFLGNNFPLKIYIDAHDLKGERTKLRILKGNSEVFSKAVTIINRSYTEVIDVELEATKKGIQHYRIVLSPQDEEFNKRNNYYDFVIDVIDSKQKILLLANSPHPDIAAIKNALKKNKNFELEYFTAKEFNKDAKDYNLVILHQLPSKSVAASALLTSLTKNKIPIIFIVGGQSNTPVINNLKFGVSIRQSKNSFAETQPIFDDRFTLFETDELIREFLQDVPPLISPFGEYKTEQQTEVFLRQKIRSIETDIPLIVFKPSYLGGDNKYCFILGEGIWKWRLHDYKINHSHANFDELMNKIIQYMALRSKKENFVINSKKVFNENERIVMEAEVYNQSFEPIDDAIVSINISDQDQQNNSFNFAPQKAGTKLYTLNAGLLGVGDYSYTASAEVGKLKYTASGRFTVLPVDLETQNNVANHQILYVLSEKHGGKLFYPDQTEELYSEISTNTQIAPIVYNEKKLMDLLNLKWIFFCIIALLTAEWFLRKYYGAY